MTTKEKIFNKALHLFNEQGIEYVGVRELAKELDISPGNLAYHFAKKEDIIAEIALALNRQNTATLVPLSEENISLTAFLQSIRQAFYNHIKYRCLLLSFVHLIKQYPETAKRYKQTREFRNNTFAQNLRQLADKGYLKAQMSQEEISDLIEHLNIMARFWISEASIIGIQKPTTATADHYLYLTCQLFNSHVTAKGKRELESFMKELKG